MPESPRPRIFLSYSRADGKAFARDLRDKLEAEKLPLWHDLVDMESGNWWHQIEKTIGSVALEHVALIVTPAALASGNVAKEWSLARARGVQVNLVQGAPDIDHSSMPKWMQAQHVFNTSEPEQWQKLIEVLNGPSMQAPVPLLPEETHDKFIPRPKEYDALKAALLDDKRDAVAITAALKGAGGFGKTALAHALSRDADIREAFFDGITFIQLGEEMSEAKLLTILAEQTQKLTGEPQAPKTLGEAGDALAEALGEKHILLVIDDVWREFDLKPFLKGGPNSARLITTRMDEVLPADAVKVPVDAMQGDEAVALLARGLPQDEVDQQRETLRALAARLGEWPLLLELANGLLRRRVTAYHETLASALAHANRRLDEKKLTTFDARNPVERNDAVAKSIAVSLELLNEDERAHFFELAIIPEDAEVPIDTIARLWHRTGSLDEIDSEDLLTHLASLSLLYSLDLQSRAARLHDVIRHYLRDEAGEEKLRALNNTFIAAQPEAGAETLEAGEKTYLYTWFLHHLRDADREDAIEPILLDPEWIKGKLEAFDTPQQLIADYKQFAPYNPLHKTAISLIGRALNQVAGPLSRDEQQLVSQLFGRIRGDMASEAEAININNFLARLRLLIKPPALALHCPTLNPAVGSLSAIFEGHTKDVNAVAFSPDGRRIASGSSDKTVRLWDVESGASRVLVEHETGAINAVSFSPDGNSLVCSGSWNGSVLLWDVESGTSRSLNKSNDGWIHAVAFSPDGQHIAWSSYDNTIRLWDFKSSSEIRCFEGHKNNVNTVAFSPDGCRLVSGSGDLSKPADNTVRLWDVESGNELFCFEGHTHRINAVTFSPDGRYIASGGCDNAGWLWDVESGTGRILNDYMMGPNAIAFSPDGFSLISGSSGMAVLWDIESGNELRRFNGHRDWIQAVAFSPCGNTIATGSADNSVRLWDVNSNATPFTGHSSSVNAVTFSPDGAILASGSTDGTVRLWDVASGDELCRFEGHGCVISVTFSPDGKSLASGAMDTTARLWDVESGSSSILKSRRGSWVESVAFSPDGKRLALSSETGSLSLWDVESCLELHCFEGYKTVAYSPDGSCLVSGAMDNTIRLWDLESGSSRILKGHESYVNSVAFSPDGNTFLSGSSDKTMRLWEVESGTELCSFDNHGDEVNEVAFSPDGHNIISGSSNGILSLWDVVSGHEQMRFEFENGVISLAFSPNGSVLAAGDGTGGIHFFDILWDENDKMRWFRRFEDSN